MKLKTVLLSVLIASCTSAYAQADSKEEALTILRRLYETYRQPAGMHFDIAFKYSHADDASKIIDSLAGQCTIQGERSYYRLDQTECIRSDNYMIVFYKEDSLMYLAKPSPQTGINPLRSLDSLFMQQQNVTITISGEERIQSLKLSFPPGSHQKEVEYRIDRQTGFLTSIVSIVRRDMIGAQDGQDASPGQYSVVETVFSNYRQGDIDPGIFEASRYFRKVGNEFVVEQAYKGYHIMLGNPDLQ